LASPFVKLPVAEKVVEAKKADVRLSFLTNFKLASLHRRLSDIDAFRILEQASRTKVKSHQLLHAKTYIFDQNFAIVTSGNLTNGGLSHNYEYGVLVEEPDMVKVIRQDFRALFRDREVTTLVTPELLDDAAAILSKIPEEKVWPGLIEAEQKLIRKVEESSIYEGGAKSIMQGLSGWKRSVFLRLNDFQQNLFFLEDIYAYEDSLAKEYPDNRFIREKIRQQLQVLRDLGLLEFLGGGKYRKLWLG
jgi:hypothetical protein